jgi:predicted phage tail protein
VQVGATYRAGRSSTIFSAYIQQENLDPRIVTFATIFPFAVLLFAWCKADATHRGIEPPNGAALLVGLFALIGIPYYYFRILPPLRAAAHAATALALLVSSMVLAGVAQWLTLKVLQSVGSHGA